MTLEAELTIPAPSQTLRPRGSWALPALFSATAFTGAALLFLVEPLVAKLLLPSFGGAATVWATATLFFQAILLAAYLFVHATARLGPRKQPYTLVPLVLLALLVLPLALPAGAAPEEREPVTWLLRTMVLMIGLPFAVLSTTGPLLQRWYSWTDAPRSQDPYFLYAASNVGSFLGLLSYPFLVEPNLDLATQRSVWSWAFAVFVMLVVVCGVVARTGAQADVVAEVAPPQPVTWGRRLRWVAFAFLPSSLMLGVTTHITTDIAAIPLLWVVPLAIYLATMVAAFAIPGRRRPLRLTQVAVLAVMVASAAAVSVTTLPVSLAVGVDLGMLAVVGLAAHRLLAADRPAPEHLTLFYVLVSLGGAAGGLLNGVLAPLLLDRPWEFPLVMLLVPFLLLAVDGSRVVAAVISLLLLVTGLVGDLRTSGEAAHRTRTFYGSYIVKSDDQQSRLIHGTTLHGTQYRDDGSGEPTTYYSRGGPLGDVFTLQGLDDVAAVGLGAGTLAAYGSRGQSITFIEIDPEVIRIARDTRYFTYLDDSAADIRTVAGDGRLVVEDMPPGSLDLVVLDAFSSDAIPVHLLTREAIGSYLERLRGDGVLAVHISNRVFDLAPVLVDAADDHGVRVLGRSGGSGPGATFAQWVVLTRSDERAAALATLDWDNLEGSPKVSWTDDYSSVLDVLQ